MIQMDNQSQSLVITDIKMKLPDLVTTKKAVFDIVFNGCFAVHSIYLIEKEGKDRFIAFYSKKDAEGKFINICHPIKGELRKYIEDTLFEYYDNHISEIEK